MRLKDAHSVTTVRLHDALRKLYGRKTERLNPNQLELFVSELLKEPENDEAQADRAAEKEKNNRKQKRKQGPRGR
ncbi:MAG: transposase [Deltaproteobacteria bacterium]|nr:transposase [Deltaproteobacteria bacterium]